MKRALSHRIAATLVLGLVMVPVFPAPGATSGNLDGLDGKIVQLSKKGTTLEDVVALLGEPQAYGWGDKSFEKKSLPERFIAGYDKGVSVVIVRGEVWELRAETPGPGFTWQGKLRLGSSLEEVLEALGQPAKTVTGQPVDFAPNVLYQDIEGQAGRAYYARPDQHVRCFFLENKVTALYVPVQQQDSFMDVKPVKQVRAFQDVRFGDMSRLDLSAEPGLPATLTFNLKTVWPKLLPPGFDPAKLLEAGMNPGLGIRKLHKAGFTGKGVNVAIIDQPLFQDHPEFAGKIVAYKDMGCESESSMHGPAVTSLLVGNRCGSAPDARVYYAAAPSWKKDAAFYAQALDWILEQNTALPLEAKIRVVSVSAAPSGPSSPFEKNLEMWDDACERAKKAGILVLDCTQHHCFIRSCFYDAADPEDVSKCRPGYPNRVATNVAKGCVLVPTSPRTVAEEYVKGHCGYQYTGEGGLSWAIPNCAGVLALGWQARPDLQSAQMRELLFSSAHKNPDGSLTINPSEFLRLVKASPRAN